MGLVYFVSAAYVRAASGSSSYVQQSALVLKFEICSRKNVQMFEMFAFEIFSNLKNFKSVICSNLKIVQMRKMFINFIEKKTNRKPTEPDKRANEKNKQKNKKY
jgi:hypothetical protein